MGGKCKKNAPLDRVEVYRINQHPVNIEYLNRFVPTKIEIDEKKLFKESKLTLDQAKEKYPEWYENKVVKQDAIDLIPFLNGLNEEEPFTEEDIKSALECYDELYNTFPLKDIEKLTNIRIERNKRNGRKQKDHVKMMNLIRDEINQNKTWNKIGNGRKPKKDIVQKWRLEHPEGKKADCIRDTGLTKPTVYKWWNIKK